MINMYEILQMNFLNNTIQQYLIALGIFLISIILLKIFKNIIVKKLKIWAKKTKTKFDDILIKAIDDIHWPFYVFLSTYIAIQFIAINATLTKAIYYILMILIVFYIVKGVQKAIKYTAKKIIKDKSKEEQEADIGSIQLMSNLAIGTLWGFAILTILSNLGYDISTLIAGLGIGGIAIAFALQNILSDMFASFSIHFDKPFKVGDFIVIGTDSGVVKHIGIKSTRIQTLQGQELVVSNKELTNSRINNYKKMEKRRVVFQIGVTYQTPKTKLEKIPEWITKIIDKSPNSEPSRVHFKSFGPSSLDYEIVYLMLVSDYAEYMNTQQLINLEIVKKFQKEKVEFAYPTQTIFLEK